MHDRISILHEGSELQELGGVNGQGIPKGNRFDLYGGTKVLCYGVRHTGDHGGCATWGSLWKTERVDQQENGQDNKSHKGQAKYFFDHEWQSFWLNSQDTDSAFNTCSSDGIRKITGRKKPYFRPCAGLGNDVILRYKSNRL